MISVASTRGYKVHTYRTGFLGLSTNSEPPQYMRIVRLETNITGSTSSYRNVRYIPDFDFDKHAYCSCDCMRSEEGNCFMGGKSGVGETSEDSGDAVY